MLRKVAKEERAWLRDIRMLLFLGRFMFGRGEIKSVPIDSIVTQTDNDRTSLRTEIKAYVLDVVWYSHVGKVLSKHVITFQSPNNIVYPVKVPNTTEVSWINRSVF